MTSKDRFHVRAYRPSTADRAACSHICVCTGDAGQDARGMLSSDEIFGEIWVLPYLDKHPEYSWVVEDTSNEGKAEAVVGYVVGTPDTAEFEKWYHDSYWPTREQRFGTGSRAGVSEREREILEHASTKGKKSDTSPPPAYLVDYPAHLHINLLPQAQGQGLGPQMINMLWTKMKDDGVKGLHLGAMAENEKACGFYRKLGMSQIPGRPDERVFAKKF